jgi:hypothetical protein
MIQSQSCFSSLDLSSDGGCTRSGKTTGSGKLKRAPFYMNATHHFNSPIRNCENCAHSIRSQTGPAFSHCSRFGEYCTIAMKYDCRLTEWRAKPPNPPSRSLRQWLRDLLWA